MKIISQFRDHYDYMVSKYGMDERLVYTRRTTVIENLPKNCRPPEHVWTSNHSILLVGNQTIHLFRAPNRLYTHFEMADPHELPQQLSRWSTWLFPELRLTMNDGQVVDVRSGFGLRLHELLTMDRKRFVEINCMRLRPYSFTNCEADYEDVMARLRTEPLILIEYLREVEDFDQRKAFSLCRFTFNPNLQSLGIFLEADFLWQSLVDFLSRQRSEREVMPEMPNELKIAMKGFDAKTSFRPKMKKK